MFTTKENLKVHFNSFHTGEKNKFNCKLCDSSLASRSGLWAHITSYQFMNANCYSNVYCKIQSKEKFEKPHQVGS